MSASNFLVVGHVRNLPGRVLAIHQAKEAELMVAFEGEKGDEEKGTKYRNYGLPALNLLSESDLPGDGTPVGTHLRVQTPSSNEIVHFSVRDSVLVRSSKKASRQTYGRVTEDLYAFGRDYVCTVTDKLNVFLDNNPRHVLHHPLPKRRVSAIVAFEDRVHVAVANGLGKILLFHLGGDDEKKELVMRTLHWHSLPPRSLRCVRLHIVHILVHEVSFNYSPF